MRRAIEFLFTRVLRSRMGVAVGVMLLVFGIVGGARLMAGSIDPGAGLSGRPAHPITTVDPTSGDDGALSTGEPSKPSTRPGALTPEQVAASFCAKWLRRDTPAPQWRDALRPLSTESLDQELAEADPTDVPAERSISGPVLTPRNEAFVEVRIPLDNGELRLELVAPDGRWLVDAVDWERP